MLCLLLAGTAFYLIPLPTAWMATQLSKQEAYFFEDEASWIRNASASDILWVKVLELKARHDLKKHLSDSLKLTSTDPAASIAAATVAMRQLYVTQLDHKIPIISNSGLASFVRGFGYCDQLNGFLAFVLHDNLDKVQLWGVVDTAGISPHTLIRSESSLGVVWVDAFTCVSSFGFEEELSTIGKKQILGYKQKAHRLYPAAYYRQGFSFNEYGFGYTARKTFTRLESLLGSTENKTKTTNTKSKGKRMARNKAQQQQWRVALAQETTENKQLFLQARFYQLYGQSNEALALYHTVIDASPYGLLAASARTFSDRIMGLNMPCLER